MISSTFPVSTHAPARGRLSPISLSKAAIRFNSRPREGATKWAIISAIRRLFQLTPPRGGDDEMAVKRLYEKGFNSRPREGATADRSRHRDAGHVSTHAPARGRRRLNLRREPRTDVSTHAPARGRLAGHDAHDQPIEFQLTPPRGGDPWDAQTLPAASVSTHAPARGRPHRKVPLLYGACFNSRPREGATR